MNLHLKRNVTILGALIEMKGAQAQSEYLFKRKNKKEIQKFRTN